MSKKENSKTARANLFVTRGRMATVNGSAQSRAFRARQVAKDARDAAERKRAATAAENAKEADTGTVSPVSSDPSGRT